MRSVPLHFLTHSVLCLGLASLMACTPKENAGKDGKGDPTAQPGAPPEPTAAPEYAPKTGNPNTMGNELLIEPGTGIGAIRFGTYVETLERLLQSKCDILTATRCVYVDLAIEFELDGGVVRKMKAERRDRVVSGLPPQDERLFGSFKGQVPPGAMLGLHKHVLEEEFGKPQREEPIDPPGPNGLVARTFYDGLVFEFDKLPNGNTVLSSIEVIPNAAAQKLFEKSKAERLAKRAPEPNNATP